MKREELVNLDDYKVQRLVRKVTLAGPPDRQVLQPEQLRELLDRNISLKVWKKGL